MSRVFLMHLRGLGALADFEQLWFSVLQNFAFCMEKAKIHDEIAEMIPEKIKNLMLVMHNLCKEGAHINLQSGGQKEFWAKSWDFVGKMSPELTAEIIG